MFKAKGLCYRLMVSRKTTTCALKQEPLLLSSSSEHRSKCLSLIVNLGRRGLVDSAKEVTRRVIDNCGSISEAALVADFAVDNGIELDSCCCGALIRKLTEMGEPVMAERLYNQRVVVDGSVLDAMVLCLVKLRKFGAARGCLDRCLATGYAPSRNDASLVVDEFCNQERFLDAFFYFEQVRVRGNGVWCCKRLFKGLCSHGYLDEAIGMLGVLCEMTSTPLPVNLYKSLFYGFCSRGCGSEAEALFDHMETDGYFVDKVMYTCLMKEYCKDNNMAMATRVYLRMVKKSCELDSYIFSTLIHGFMKLGMLDQGRVMFSQMIKKGVDLNVFTYHIMIGSYCKEGNVDYALRLFENHTGVEDVSRSVHCYTNLISALYKKGGLDKAVDLLMKMLDNGVVPDHITYFVLLKMLPRCHELKYAMVILQAIVDNGYGIEPPVIDDDLETVEVKVESLLEEIARKDSKLAAEGLAVVTTALCSQRKFSAALSRIEKMANLGCTPLPFSYNSVIKCLFQEGVIKDFGFLVNLIQEWGFVPDPDTYLIVVNELCKKNDRDAAFAVIGVMEELGLRPTVAIYSAIISSLGKEGKVGAAEETFVKMLETGIQPDEIAYMIMINAYARHGRMDQANELVEEVVKLFLRPSSFTYTVLISGFVKSGMFEKGCEFLDKMLKDGLSPNVVLYTSLIGHFLKKGDYKFSFTLFGLMGEKGHDHIAYITLLSGLWRAMARKQKREVSVEPTRKERLLQRLLQTKPLASVPSSTCNYGSKSFAMEVIGKVKKTMVPNLYLHNTIINGYCASGRLDEAYRHLELMQKEGIVPNQVTFTILMKYHIEQGDIESAIDLFEEKGFEPDQVMYNTLLNGLCECGRPIGALNLLLEMQKKGLYPRRYSYEKLLQCLCYSRLTVEAVKLFKDMAAVDFWPSSVSHTWLIYILCEAKKFREARALFAIMVQSGRSLLNCTKPGLLRMLNQDQQF